MYFWQWDSSRVRMCVLTKWSSPVQYSYGVIVKVFVMTIHILRWFLYKHCLLHVDAGLVNLFWVFCGEFKEILCSVDREVTSVHILWRKGSRRKLYLLKQVIYRLWIIFTWFIIHEGDNGNETWHNQFLNKNFKNSQDGQCCKYLNCW